MGSSIRVTSRSSELLPTPLCPTMEVMVPRAIETLPIRSWTPEKVSGLRSMTWLAMNPE